MKKIFIYRYKLLSVLTILILSTTLLTSCSEKESSIPAQLQEGSGGHVARIFIKNYGSFDLRLFDSCAEDTVKSFIDYAESGYYEGLPVYSVINDYCILLGNNTAIHDTSDNTIRSSSPKADMKLYPLTGSLCVIKNGDRITAENFMIITADTAFLSNLKDLLAYKKITVQEYLKTAYGKDIDDSTLDIFYKYGGAPWLTDDCIVFGQITDGMDIIQNISTAEVSEDASYSPLEEILIDHIEVR